MDGKHFPSDVYEAIAYLYVQAQDLTGKQPEDLLAMYKNALDALEQERHKANKDVAARWVH